MICRHKPLDRDCGSNQGYYERVDAIIANTPDAEKFIIEEAVRIFNHLVLKVKYPNCAKCAFEGVKVMVFLDVTETQVLRWRKIDPHFRDTSTQRLIVESSADAPSPAARFPASTAGWNDAIEYARSKK